MDNKSMTALKILEASRQLFNSMGYASTSINDIAVALRISKGNVTYHFPTKRSIADALIEVTRKRTQERRNTRRPGKAMDDYIEHLVFAMSITWDFRFVFRDREEFSDVLTGSNSEFVKDFEELLGLVQRMERESMFRKDAIQDLSQLTRALWIVSRYWMDHVHEFEGKDQILWTDQMAGIRQHYSILALCLTAPARRQFKASLKRINREQDGREFSLDTGLSGD